MKKINKNNCKRLELVAILAFTVVSLGAIAPLALLDYIVDSQSGSTFIQFLELFVVIVLAILVSEKYREKKVKCATRLGNILSVKDVLYKNSIKVELKAVRKIVKKKTKLDSDDVDGLKELEDQLDYHYQYIGELYAIKHA